jgi:hypothetical protein
MRFSKKFEIRKNWDSKEENMSFKIVEIDITQQNVFKIDRV